jgi:hypothetical protein
VKGHNSTLFSQFYTQAIPKVLLSKPKMFFPIIFIAVLVNDFTLHVENHTFEQMLSMTYGTIAA